jgi:hypothetical protein
MKTNSHARSASIGGNSAENLLCASARENVLCDLENSLTVALRIGS